MQQKVGKAEMPMWIGVPGVLHEVNHTPPIGPGGECLRDVGMVRRLGGEDPGRGREREMMQEAGREAGMRRGGSAARFCGV